MKKTTITQAQEDAVYAIGTKSRVNLHEIHPRVARALIKKRLIEKQWNSNDASGEKLKLTDNGRSAFKQLFT
jgi:hypothetical protein